MPPLLRASEVRARVEALTLTRGYRHCMADAGLTPLKVS